MHILVAGLVATLIFWTVVGVCFLTGHLKARRAEKRVEAAFRAAHYANRRPSAHIDMLVRKGVK